MKEEKLFEALADIDEAYIEEARTTKKTSIYWIRWAGLVASLSIIAIGALTLWPKGKKDQPLTPPAPTTEASGPVATWYPEGGCSEGYHGDELGMYEKYKYKVDAGAYTDYVPGRVIAWENSDHKEDLIGEKLTDVTVTAGWVRVGKWEAIEHARAEIYRIQGVEETVAVALLFLDPLEAQITNCYYVILNPTADLTPVSQYIIEKYPNNELEE